MSAGGDIGRAIRHVAASSDDPTWYEIRTFCLRTVKQFYGIDYTPAWHADLDSLLRPETENWFSTSNRGSLYFARDQKGEVIAAGGLYGLSRKPATAERFAARYADADRVCQIVRVYLDASVRRNGLGQQIVNLLEVDAKALGYGTSYLHADAEASGTLAFWRRCGYREFGRFSYPSARGMDTSVDFDKPL